MYELRRKESTSRRPVKTWQVLSEFTSSSGIWNRSREDFPKIRQRKPGVQRGPFPEWFSSWSGYVSQQVPSLGEFRTWPDTSHVSPELQFTNAKTTHLRTKNLGLRLSFFRDTHWHVPKMFFEKADFKNIWRKDFLSLYISYQRVLSLNFQHFLDKFQRIQIHFVQKMC